MRKSPPLTNILVALAMLITLAASVSPVVADDSAAAQKSLLEAFPAWTAEPYIHWSAHVSLYSAKTRSYMIKKGINFIETTPYAGVAGDKGRWDEVIMKEKEFFPFRYWICPMVNLCPTQPALFDISRNNIQNQPCSPPTRS